MRSVNIKNQQQIDFHLTLQLMNLLFVSKITQPIAKIREQIPKLYFRMYWDMITQSVNTMSFAPVGYPMYANQGCCRKPFAVVNAGSSVGLSGPPLQTQTTLHPSPATTLDSLPNARSFILGG